MARQRDPRQVLKEAKQIALDHGMFVVERPGTYLLYREEKPANVFIGKRGSVEGIRALVARCAWH